MRRACRASIGGIGCRWCKAMGLNTVCAYLFWNVHEPQPGRVRLVGPGGRRRVLPHRAGGRAVGHSATRALFLRRVGNGRASVVAAQGQGHSSCAPATRASWMPARRYLKEVGRVLGPLQITQRRPHPHGAGRERIWVLWQRRGIHGRPSPGAARRRVRCAAVCLQSALPPQGRLPSRSVPGGQFRLGSRRRIQGLARDPAERTR